MINSITGASNLASSIASSTLMATNLLLAIPDSNYGMMPQDEEGFTQVKDAFMFDIEGDQTLDLVSEITDHPTENNLSTTDSIAIKPDIYTVSGFIGELNNVVPKQFRELEIIQSRLWVVQELAPALTIAGQQAYNATLSSYKAIENMKKLVNEKISSIGDNKSFDGIGQISSNGLVTENSTFNDISKINKAQSKQQIALQKLYIYRNNRIGFTIQTPWAIMRNMYIEKISVRQSEGDRFMSEFSVTFKMIRKSRSVSENETSPNSEIRAFQLSPKIEGGEYSKGVNVGMRSVLP